MAKTSPSSARAEAPTPKCPLGSLSAEQGPAGSTAWESQPGAATGQGLGTPARLGSSRTPRVGTEGTGMAAGKAAKAGQDEAQADWILCRNPKDSLLALLPFLGDIWSPRAKAPGVAEAQCQLCCAAIPEAAPEPALPWALPGDRGDTEAQPGFAFPQHPGTNSSPKAPKAPGITEGFRLERICQISESSWEVTVARPP